MREISLAEGISVDEYIAVIPTALRQLVNEVRRKKQAGERPYRSKSPGDGSPHQLMVTATLGTAEFAFSLPESDAHTFAELSSLLPRGV